MSIESGHASNSCPTIPTKPYIAASCRAHSSRPHPLPSHQNLHSGAVLPPSRALCMLHDEGQTGHKMSVVLISAAFSKRNRLTSVSSPSVAASNHRESYMKKNSSGRLLGACTHKRRDLEAGGNFLEASLSKPYFLGLFWLRSSVVSVLISLISDMESHGFPQD